MKDQPKYEFIFDVSQGHNDSNLFQLFYIRFGLSFVGLIIAYINNS